MMKNCLMVCAVIFTVIIVLVLGGCFSDWQLETSGTGTITISFNSYTSESARNRSTLPPWPPAENSLLGYIEYEITLSRAGESIPTFTAKSGDTISRVVSAGLWTIKIDAYLQGAVTDFSPEGERIYYATGSRNIQVIEGRDNPAAVPMFPICQECEKHLCSCDDPKSDFYGTWSNDHFIVIISKYLFIFQDTHNTETYEYPIIDWTINDDPDNIHGLDYQRSYIITYEYFLDGGHYTLIFFIHNNGNSIIYYDDVFYKQTICHDWRWTATTPQTPCMQERTCSICGETETRHVDDGCTGTQGLVINNGVVEYNAAYLTMTNVCIPDYRNGAAVTSLGSWAFNYEGAWDGTENTSLRSVRIGTNVTSIDNEAFLLCSSLTTVTFASGSGLQTIGDGAFTGCTSLTNLEIPENVTVIGNYAFHSTGFTSITIPKSVSTIGRGAFATCASLTSITIPKNVNTIGQQAFEYCSKLTAINVDNDNPNYSSDEYGILYNKEKTTLIQAPGAISGNIILPNTITSIGYRAFAGCVNLQTVTFAPGSQLQIIDQYAFSDCAGLTAIEIPYGVTDINSRAFYNCVSLASIEFPASLIRIRDVAFENCILLNNVNIPASVTSINFSAFNGCANLTAINVNLSNPNYSSDDYGILYNKEKTNLIRAPQPISGNIVLPDSLTGIWTGSFEHCVNLTGITIPASVTSIGGFSGCINLTTVTFTPGSQLQTIQGSTFRGCDKLTEITIPASVTEIGMYAFMDSANLTTVNFEPGSQLERILNGTFQRTSLANIIIPENVSLIGIGAFSQCTNLASITIPASVTLIQLSAFANCTLLTTVIFERDSTSIADNNSFPYGASLRTAYYDGGAGTYILNGTTWVKEQ